jgi:hypothetical protein
MAMSPTDMADAIYSEMEKAYWPSDPLPAQAEAETKKYYTVIATAIIDYIKKNCDVLPGSFNVPSAGNVTGVGTVT